MIALGALVGCTPTAPPKNVVFICFDTVRADHLGPYGYEKNPTTPFLDELAERSIVFSSTSSTAGWTKPSVPSFMTGLMPSQHGVYEGSARAKEGTVSDVLPKSATTLAEVFKARGYATAAFIRNAQLRSGSGIEQGFDVYRDRAGDAREIRWRGLDWLDGRDGKEPFFLYLHYLDAHWPYPVPDEYASMFASEEAVAPFRASDSRALRDAINDGDVELDAEGRANLEALYDGSIRYLDDQLALLVRGLEQRGLLEDTVLCIVSDHGEEFGEHGRIGHGHGLWETLLDVPWILTLPEGPGSRIDTSVSLVDLFPTLLSAAGLAVPHAVDGIDRLRDPDATRPVFAEHKAPDRYLQSARAHTDKLIRTFELDAPEERVFPIRPGTRWEAELAVDAEGGFRAIQFKPRDEDVDDPAELKGPIDRLDASSLWIVGVQVERTPTTQLAPNENAPEELREGLVVKVRGSVTDGVLVAERIKIYAEGSVDGPPELRARVDAVDDRVSEASVLLGGFSVRADDETVFKDADTTRKPRLERSAIVARLEEGAESSQAGRLEFEALRFELSKDPYETAGVPTDASDPLSRLLDEEGRRWAQSRVFQESDASVLTPDEIERLRAIGYGD